MTGGCSDAVREAIPVETPWNVGPEEVTELWLIGGFVRAVSVGPVVPAVVNFASVSGAIAGAMRGSQCAVLRRYQEPASLCLQQKRKKQKLRPRL
jgi:hypothetical protein